jgi:hypothetical protein
MEAAHCKLDVWLMPVIPATREVEIGGLWFYTSPGQRDPISKNKLGRWYTFVTPGTW